ncbi:MAG: CoA transferase, partial [Acidimicrobiia bacterium]|nr:CoA transferase [Acidimicrobiia bacterium]
MADDASTPTPVRPSPPQGPFRDIRVVEFAHERCAWAGKLLADQGAEVIVVEPPGGAAQRCYGPFAGDDPDPERSLWWWHYNTSKLGVTLDLAGSDADRVRLQELVAGADVVLDGEDPGGLGRLGVDRDALLAADARLIWASVTPFGSQGARSQEASTDLTVMAAGGPMWSCGYDDHSLPPVRGGGNQGLQMGSHFAVLSVMTALLSREVTGQGQFIDVNMHAAANVTTEFASYGWLVANQTVQRQTGRHATPRPTGPTQVRCADGRFANTGVPPRKPGEFKLLAEWLHELGLADEFPEMAQLVQPLG